MMEVVMISTKPVTVKFVRGPLSGSTPATTATAGCRNGAAVAPSGPTSVSGSSLWDAVPGAAGAPWLPLGDA